MERFIVYLDDADYAQQQLAPLKNAAMPAAHWVLVACAPRLTQRIGKWVSHSARENWRNKWAQKLFERAVPALRSPGDVVTTVLAKRPLPELTRQLVTQHGAARVIDARRPKFGHELPPVTEGQPTAGKPAWEVPGAVACLGAALMLAAD
jgi:hypothetical protein